MSHVATQRVVVRMLYDAIFAAAVYTDVARATAGCDLLETERAWLVAPDPRAYAVDPLRRARALTGLLEEYAVSCAELVRARGRAAATDALDAFFSSQAFHRCVQEGDSMAESFGTWMLSSVSGITDPMTHAVVDLERAIVRARRARERAPVWRVTSADPQTSWLVLAPGIVVHETDSGVLGTYGAALRHLRTHARGLVEEVLDAASVYPPLVCGAEPAGVIVHGQTEEVGLEPTSRELARVLAACAVPIAFGDFVEHASVEGATREDCVSLVESFVGDGVVCVVDRP